MIYSMPWTCDCGTKNTSEVDYYFDPVCCSACGAWFEVDYDETYNEETEDEYPIWSLGVRTEKPRERNRFHFPPPLLDGFRIITVPADALPDGTAVVIHEGEVVGVFENVGKEKS